MPSDLGYAGSVNPPRRAKRLRADSATASGAARPILPRPAPLSATASRSSRGEPDDEEDEIEDEEPEDEEDGDTPPPPKKRSRAASSSAGAGAPSAPLSRAARESLRKQNHSRIEKARRTKINGALAELRVLVPRPPSSDDPTELEEAEARGKAGAKGKEEKEFKLEVLVRTVSYLKNLVARVAELEATSPDTPCARCDTGPPASPTRSRKTSTTDAPPPLSTAPSGTAPPESPRLPPIASWLPLIASSDPSALPSLSPHTSPLLFSTSRAQSQPSSAYPSPPSSGAFPAALAARPPALALPPARVSPGGTAAVLPALAPLDVPVEEDGDDARACAAWLLRLKARGSVSGPAPVVSGPAPVAGSAGRKTQGQASAQTPASLLGMKRAA